MEKEPRKKRVKERKALDKLADKLYRGEIKTIDDVDDQSLLEVFVEVMVSGKTGGHRLKAAERLLDMKMNAGDDGSKGEEDLQNLTE